MSSGINFCFQYRLILKYINKPDIKKQIATYGLPAVSSRTTSGTQPGHYYNIATQKNKKKQRNMQNVFNKQQNAFET